MISDAPLWRYKVERVFTYGLVALGFALLLNSYAKIPFHPVQLIYALFGVLIGLIEQVFFKGRIARLPVYLQLVLRIVLISIITSAIVSLLVLVQWVPAPENGVAPRTLGELWQDQRMLHLISNALTVAAFVILFMEMERLVGTRMFWRFLTGRYVHPRREEKVVMFMDLIDSTRFTEELGDERYYAMLNETFERLSAPVLRNDAEILKYVGDEVILTWSVDRAGRCLDLFFDLRDSIDRDAAHYRKAYGMVPRFRAGIHRGEVITSQVGSIKRTIDHNGDAMNTCARLVSAAKELGAELLASEALLLAMPALGRKFTMGELTEVELRGKSQPLEVRSVQRAVRSAHILGAK